MPEYVIPEARTLKPGQKLITSIGGREIGLYNVGGQFYAIRNRCAHQMGPACQGDVFDRIEAKTTPDRKIKEYVAEYKTVLACPWHGWEYDLRTGVCLWNKQYKVRTYRVGKNENGEVTISL